jgi:hypothetical protein
LKTNHSAPEKRDPEINSIKISGNEEQILKYPDASGQDKKKSPTTFVIEDLAFLKNWISYLQPPIDQLRLGFRLF